MNGSPLSGSGKGVLVVSLHVQQHWQCDAVNSQTCFGERPQFISLQGSRIWANLDGKWMTTDKVERDQSLDPRRVTFLKQGLRTERTVIPSKGFPSAIMPEAAHHPLFIAENFEGNGCVAIAAHNFEKLFNNNARFSVAFTTNP